MNVEIFFSKQKYTERQTKKTGKKITDDQHLQERHQKGKHKNGKCY